MNHEKTFDAISKLQVVEMELHRLKNALEIANKALSERDWVSLTNEDIAEIERWVEFKEAANDRIQIPKLVLYIEKKIREKHNG